MAYQNKYIKTSTRLGNAPPIWHRTQVQGLRKSRLTIEEVETTSLYHHVVISYLLATRGTIKLLSRGTWEDLGNCCQRPLSKIFSTTEGQLFDCSPSRLEITVSLPNCFKCTETLSLMLRCSLLISGHLTFRDVICHVTSQQCSVDRSTVDRSGSFYLIPA